MYIRFVRPLPLLTLLYYSLLALTTQHLGLVSIYSSRSDSSLCVHRLAFKLPSKPRGSSVRPFGPRATRRQRSRGAYASLPSALIRSPNVPIFLPFPTVDVVLPSPRLNSTKLESSLFPSKSNQPNPNSTACRPCPRPSKRSPPQPSSPAQKRPSWPTRCSWSSSSCRCSTHPPSVHSALILRRQAHTDQAAQSSNPAPPTRRCCETRRRPSLVLAHRIGTRSA